MTDLNNIQLNLLEDLAAGNEPTIKGIEKYNVMRALRKAGYLTPEGIVTSAGLHAIRSESPQEPRTAKIEKRATPAPEIAKQVPLPAPIAYKPPAPRQERKEYEPDEPFQRIVDEKQKTIGYLITKEGLSHALNLKGVLVNRGINHTTAEKRYRQLIAR